MEEQGLRFRKSSRSEDVGHCVEVALTGAGAAVRDSKNAGGPVLRFGGAVLPTLVGKIRTGSLDLPR